MNFTTAFVIQDYETDLAAYTSGLETLLNIPIKRTMLKSPSTDLNQEVIPLIFSVLKMKTHLVHLCMLAEGLTHQYIYFDSL